MPDDLRDLSLTTFQKEFFLRRIKAARHLSQTLIPRFLDTALIRNFENEISFFPTLAYDTYFNGEFERIVINRTVNENRKNERLSDYSQIKYPPLEIEKKLDYNRASLKGQSVFYGGAGSLPAILETRPELGDLYTVSKWRQKKGTSIYHLPIFYNNAIYERPEFEKDWQEHNQLISTLDPNVQEVVSEFLSFMTEVFIKKVDKDNKVGYIFSSYLLIIF